MKRMLLIIVAAALIGTSGVLHAIQTNAWTKDKVLSVAAQKLDQLPYSYGGWQGTHLEFDPQQLRVAQATGAISRTYRSDTQREVNLMLLCGPSGPIAVHPPTVCFVSAGYRQVTEQRRVEVRSKTGESIGSFWVADFEWPRGEGTSERIRTYWGWSTDGRWKSPDYPRYEFAGSQALYKLYVTHRVTENDGDAEPAKEFLTAFLPSANAVMFPFHSETST